MNRRREGKEKERSDVTESEGGARERREPKAQIGVAFMYRTFFDRVYLISNTNRIKETESRRTISS